MAASSFVLTFFVFVSDICANNMTNANIIITGDAVVSKYIKNFTKNIAPFTWYLIRLIFSLLV